jgi:hypothetical protein
VSGYHAPKTRPPTAEEISDAADLCAEAVRLRARAEDLHDDLIIMQENLRKHGIEIKFFNNFAVRKIKNPPRTPLDKT